MKKIWFLLLLFLLLPSSTFAFVLGLKSTDNTVENIVKIEKDYNLYLPLIGFIYDPRERQDVVQELEKMNQQLWNKRIYHISVSPNHFSAQEVADGAFDREYTLFFQTIKRLKLKVIFRTMHEMNGGWYPRGSNPENFKKAWIHVWNLSRSLGLDQEDILFDFSVNHWDMPTLWKPSQQAKLIQCKPDKKCHHFEDYFPGEAYVDIVGATFYNRWKATSNRLWKNPWQILNDPEWKTLERLKSLWKPLFIDEVWTTAVWYDEKYSSKASRSAFLSTESDTRKNQWLKELSALLKANHFLGAIYFNVDYTNGLTLPSVWEADRAIINTTIDKFYDGFWDLYSSSKSDFSSLLTLFWLKIVEVNGNERFISQKAAKDLKFIETLVNEKITDPKEKSDLYKKLWTIPSGKKNFDEAIEILKEAYTFSQLQTEWIMTGASIGS